MNKLFTIGEMARLFGINAKTLRFYDESGLLKPEHTDPQNGYRYYSTLQFERLNTIKYLKALHMPLGKIKQFFENKDIDQMIEILEEQQQEVERQKRELERIEQKIRGRLKQLTDSASTIYDRVEEKFLGERKLAVLRTEIPVSDDLEYPIRQLEIETQLEAAMFLGKVGVSVSEEHLKERKYHEFSSVFVILEPEDSYEGEMALLSADYYLTLRYCGTHTQSEKYYNHLFDYMEKHNYKQKGSSVEITLIDSGITNDPAQFVTELQIPFEAYNIAHK